ncbi:MAG TPA: hypothetical protein VN829_24435 [Dongiaceae bacterium]|nr:hypothetical protein [Dongiaceae bacterium]
MPGVNVVWKGAYGRLLDPATFSRMRLDTDGSGPIRNASLDGKPVPVEKDSSLRLPPDFEGGTVVLRTAGG